MPWFLCLASLLWGAALADEPSEEEEPPDAALEEALAADRAAREERPTAPAPRAPTGVQGMNPDISLIGDVAFAWFSAEPDQRGGHDPNRNGFVLQQLELAVSSAVDPYFRFDAYVVFSEFGVEIEEVYATTLALPLRSQIRVGQFLTRFGRFNPTHLHDWAFVDQPLPIGRIFGGEGNRGLGVEGSVLLPLPWFAEVLVSETMAHGASTARSFYGGTDLGVDTPLDLQTTAALKQFFPFGTDLSLMWGLSWAGGPNPTGRANRTDVFGTDLYLRYRPVRGPTHTAVTLHSEWFHRRRQVPGDVLLDLNGFTQATWRFAPRWSVGARHELGTAPRDLAGDRVLDPLDPEWTDTRHRLSSALTYWPTEFSRIRLQGARDLAPWKEEPAWAAFLAFEFAVGAHGAHPF